MKVTKSYLRSLIKEELSRQPLNEGFFKDLKNKFFGKKKPAARPSAEPEAAREQGPTFRDMMQSALDFAARAYGNASDDRTYQNAQGAAALGVIKASQEMGGFSAWKEKFNFDEASQIIKSDPYGRPFSSGEFYISPSEAGSYLERASGERMMSRISRASQEYDDREKRYNSYGDGYYNDDNYAWSRE